MRRPPGHYAVRILAVLGLAITLTSLAITLGGR